MVSLDKAEKQRVANIWGLDSLVEIDLLGDGVDHHILEQSVPLDGTEDLRLGLLSESDGLGVAPLHHLLACRRLAVEEGGTLTPSKLKMPASSQPCSSSPINERLHITPER
jgi:hypothetical protein